jgi:hypothetical protein
LEGSKPPLARSRVGKQKSRKIVKIAAVMIAIIITMLGAVWWLQDQSGYTKINLDIVNQNRTLHLKGTDYNFSYSKIFINGQFQEQIHVTNGSDAIDLNNLMRWNHYDVLGLYILIIEYMPDLYIVLKVKPI